MPVALLAAAAGAVAAPLPCAESGLPYTPCPAAWEHVGPATYTDGRAVGGASLRDGDDDDDGDDFGVEESARAERRRARYGAGAGSPPTSSQSATQYVAEAAPGTWLTASVNGGVWRSRDIYAATPHWENVLDGQPVRCSSISALATSPFDNKWVVAGCGPSTSGEMGNGWQVLSSGDWGGVMESRDGGDTWRMAAGFPVNYYVTSVAFPSKGSVAISAFSQFYNETDGGVWLSSDGGATFARTLHRQTFNLLHDPKSDTLLAAVANDRSGAVWRSGDGGQTWAGWSGGLSWGSRVTYYACVTINSDGVVFVGTFARKPDALADTASQIWWQDIGSDKGWTEVAGQPTNLDKDLMPKDRMAVFSDPGKASVLYVNGNAGAVAYRVDWKNGDWTKLWGNRQGEPHGDCRNFAWESQKSNLLLVSDGGVFMRTQPRSDSGAWRSLNGDSGAMEFVTAAWDARLSRWVGGAQDNGVQLSPPNATATQAAVSIIGGDGTLVEVDNTHKGDSRVWGCIYGLAGLGFWQGHGSSVVSVELPLSKWFPETRESVSKSFPFFVHPFSLNTQDPTKVVVHARGLDGAASAWWEIDVPAGAKSVSDIAKPVKIAETGHDDVYTFVVGGWTDGAPDPSVLAGVNNSHLLYRSRATGGKVVRRPLPGHLAVPVEPQWEKNGLGPQTHSKVAFITLSPQDSSTVVVTGWPSVEDNARAGAVWLSRDAGGSWDDVTGDLPAASATVGRARPQGPVIIDFPDLNASALLIGAWSGAFVSWTDAPGKWARLGRCADLPLVMVAGLQYEAYSDTLVAATYGRGVYVLHGAKRAVADSRAQQRRGACSARAAAAPASSARFLPPQL